MHLALLTQASGFLDGPATSGLAGLGRLVNDSPGGSCPLCLAFSQPDLWGLRSQLCSSEM